MTNFDATFDIPNVTPAAVPRRHGIWRVISLLAVIAALAISAASVLQSRDAGNVPVLDRAEVSLEDLTVTLGDLDAPNGARVAVLGLAASESSRTFDPQGTTVDAPVAAASLIALTSGDGSIVGLAIANPDTGDSDRAVELSVRSTARALLFLSPGILRPTVEATLANVSVVEQDEAFAKLLTALEANPNLSQSNPTVEQAHAEIADRTPVQRRQPDQGCDSVFASNAYPSAGTCVQPKDTGLVIANEQDRWALIYSGTDGFTDLCAMIAPTNNDGSEVLIPSEQCVGDSLIVAPGPVVNQGDIQPTIDDRIRTAAAVNSLYDYVGPFAEVAGASAGFTADSVQHIRRNADEIEASLSLLLANDEEFAAAMDVSRSSSTALDRHTSAVSAARAIIELADTTALIPQRVAGDTSHLDLLDFFVRSGERMVSERTDWRWEADATGMANFEVDS